MLDTTFLQAHLARITYKEGWSFDLYDGEFEGQHLVIRATIPDAKDPEKDTYLDIHSMLPPMGSAGEFDRWLAWRLARIETHEMREWLKRDGQPIYDPHAPRAEHDLPARSL